MSRKATCMDNAVAENFFGHLKEEMFHHDTFTSADYIRWRNTERISIKRKGLSPGQYWAQALVI